MYEPYSKYYSVKDELLNDLNERSECSEERYDGVGMDDRDAKGGDDEQV